MANIERKTHTIDAEGEVLGRLATRVATLLIGKGKPDYTPHIDSGDIVIIKNISKIGITGKKLEQEGHIYSTGYPGGLRTIPWSKLMKEKPWRLFQITVNGMLPKNKLRKERIKRLKFE